MYIWFESYNISEWSFQNNPLNNALVLDLLFTSIQHVHTYLWFLFVIYDQRQTRRLKLVNAFWMIYCFLIVLWNWIFNSANIMIQNSIFLWQQTQLVKCPRTSGEPPENRKLQSRWLGIRIICQSGATYLLFQWASTIKIQLSLLVWDKADLIIILLKINLFSPWSSWKIAEFAAGILRNKWNICYQIQP